MPNCAVFDYTSKNTDKRNLTALKNLNYSLLFHPTTCWSIYFHTTRVYSTKYAIVDRSKYGRQYLYIRWSSTVRHTRLHTILNVAISMNIIHNFWPIILKRTSSVDFCSQCWVSRFRSQTQEPLCALLQGGVQKIKKTNAEKSSVRSSAVPCGDGFCTVNNRRKCYRRNNRFCSLFRRK